MATYEYRCRTCETRFELRRPMAEADAPASCPRGHDQAVRLLSVFAAVGSSSAVDRAPATGAVAPGPCGGSCACYPG
jgi:putative FmdB family regulatory protein